MDNVFLDALTEAPAAYPYTLHTFAADGTAYEIIGGNRKNRYSITGSEFKIEHAVGVDFEDPEVDTVQIRAAKNGVSKFFSISSPLGDAWFALDALWAWDAIKDTNPSDGGLMRVGYAGSVSPTFTASGGFWTADSTARLNSGVPLNAPTDIDLTNDLFFAVTLAIPSGFSNWKIIFTIANNPAVRLMQLSGAVLTSLSGTDWNADVSIPYTAGVPLVLWGVLRSGKELTAGGNQTIVDVVSAATTRASLGNYFNVPQPGTDATGVGYGALQIVSRPSITDAEAKAMVAKMQTLHSIT